MLYYVSLLNINVEVLDQPNSAAVGVNDHSKFSHRVEYIGCIVVYSEGNKSLKSFSKFSRRNYMSTLGGYGPAKQRPVWFGEMLCRSQNVSPRVQSCEPHALQICFGKLRVS